MLHTLMKSPFETDIPSMLNLLKESDDFLALQDGVLIAVVNNVYLKKIILSSAKLYVLEEDVNARGIYKQISRKFILINYIHFVSLTLKNKIQIIW